MATICLFPTEITTSLSAVVYSFAVVSSFAVVYSFAVVCSFAALLTTFTYSQDFFNKSTVPSTSSQKGGGPVQAGGPCRNLPL